MHDVKGKKAVLVLASGMDTFSRLTFDKTHSQAQGNRLTIFCVGVAEQLALRQEMFGGAGTNSLSFIQAQHQLKTFAALTGGRYWSPRFDGEVPGIMADVAGSLRNQYSLATRLRTRPWTGNIARSRWNWWLRTAGRLPLPMPRARSESAGVRAAGLHGAQERRQLNDDRCQLSRSPHAGRFVLNSLAPRSTRFRNGWPLNQRSRLSISNSASLSQSRSLTPLVCGVISTFSSDHSGLSGGSGSCEATSSAGAGDRAALQSAATSAGSSTSEPRATLIRIAVGFISASCGAPIM